MTTLSNLLKRLEPETKLTANDGTIWDADNLIDHVADDTRDYCHNAVGVFLVDDNDHMVFPPVYRYTVS